MTLESKVKSLSSNLRWDRAWGSKKEFFHNLISCTLSKPCPYCGIEITLENMSLDHKEPFSSNEARRDVKEHHRLNNPKNLHIVCRDCNAIKGNLTHEQYKKLLKFLNKEPEIKEYIMKRLKQSKVIWQKH